jgi:large subunit ribosomal protein L22
MAEEKKDIREVKAFARGIHISPRKARLVAAVVSKLPVGDALTQLEFMTKKAAHPIKKLINSAVANASHNFQIETDRLFVKNLTIDQGQVFMRYQPRAQGRAFPVRKRTSHMSLTLGVASGAFKTRKKFLPPKKETKEEMKPQGSLASEKAREPEKKSSRFAFWRRRKEQDTTQVPPKEDVKGKHYTGFDRRGKMGE